MVRTHLDLISTVLRSRGRDHCDRALEGGPVDEEPRVGRLFPPGVFEKHSAESRCDMIGPTYVHKRNLGLVLISRVCALHPNNEALSQ